MVSPEFGSTGREWDKELGLYYYRARYYDPVVGRFISKDPIGFSGGDVNLYRYVGNDPVNWVDPLGLRSCNFWKDVRDNFKQTNDTIGMGRMALTTGFGSSFAKTYGGYTVGQYITKGVAPHLGRHLSTMSLVARTTALNSALITGAFETGVAVGSVLNVGADWLINEPDNQCECQ